MKRFTVCLVILVLMMSLAAYAASAETLGFGFVNATDVALRRGVGGKVFARLPKDTCVWISDSRTDGDGVLWYEISAGLHIDNANYDYSGWMKAEFIDAGDDVWHDISAIAAGRHGLIVLRNDGSTETAGRPIVSMDGSRWVSPRGWADSYGRAIHVGVPNSGNGYFIVTENNEFVSSVNGLRVANGLAMAASLEAAEEPSRDTSFPEWTRDAETVVYRSAALWFKEEARVMNLCIGVRADGSVIAEPAQVAELLTGWSDIIDIRVTDRYVLGLKRDGTAALAALRDSVELDVSLWEDVIAIGGGNDWCVGLKSDGTLVFEGEHIFMNEGHSRK